MKLGKHKKVITLPSFMGSIIQYSRPLDVQKDLDIDFREMHPSIDPTLTLTMIRDIKWNMLEIGKLQDMEMSSVAISFVYFEKLVLKGSFIFYSIIDKDWSTRLTEELSLLLA